MNRNMHPVIHLYLLDPEMMICHTGDLGQMRYAEQLMSLRNFAELPADSLRGLAANARIHFVEDQHRHAVNIRKDAFERKHDP